MKKKQKKKTLETEGMQEKESIMGVQWVYKNLSLVMPDSDPDGFFYMHQTSM